MSASLGLGRTKLRQRCDAPGELLCGSNKSPTGCTNCVGLDKTRSGGVLDAFWRPVGWYVGNVSRKGFRVVVGSRDLVHVAPSTWP